MMAESVNDVATVQRSLQRTLQSTEDDLAAQARLTRDLQDDLLRTRMVEFESLSDRLYRVARQAAKETAQAGAAGHRRRLDRSRPRRARAHGRGLRAPAAQLRHARHRVARAARSRGQGRRRPDHRHGAPRRQRSRGRFPRRRRRPEPAAHPRARRRHAACSPPTRRRATPNSANLIFTPGFSTADSGDRAGRPRRRHGRRARRGQRAGRPHRDRQRAGPGHELPPACCR